MFVPDYDQMAQQLEDKAARFRAGLPKMRAGTRAHTIAKKEMEGAEEVAAKYRIKAAELRARGVAPGMHRD